MKMNKLLQPILKYNKKLNNKLFNENDDIKEETIKIKDNNDNKIINEI